MHAVLHPDFASLHQHAAVELKGLDCGPTDRRPSNDTRGGGAPAEMLIPAIRARIEEGYDPPGARILGFSASLLVEVTLGATKAEIVGMVRSAA